MKTKEQNQNLVSQLLTLLAVLGLLAALALPSVAHADPQNYSVFPAAINFTGFSNATVNASSTNIYYNAFTGVYQTNGDYSIAVPQNSQLVFQTSVTSANGTNGSLTSFGLNVNVAGNGDTNFSTTTPISITAPSTGTNTSVSYYVMNFTNVTGLARFRWDTVVTTQTNALTDVRLRVGFKNISTSGY